MCIRDSSHCTSHRPANTPCSQGTEGDRMSCISHASRAQSACSNTRPRLYRYLCPPPLPPPPTTGGLIHHHTLFGDGDQLPPIRTMDGFHLLFRFFRKPVQLLLQCTHFLTQLGQPLFQSQHMFYARQVETVTRSQLLNVTQLLHIFHRVEARALGRPLGRDKPFPLIHAKGLGMHLRQVRGYRNHEESTLLVCAHFGIDHTALALSC